MICWESATVYKLKNCGGVGCLIICRQLLSVLTVKMGALVMWNRTENHKHVVCRECSAALWKWKLAFGWRADHIRSILYILLSDCYLSPRWLFAAVERRPWGGQKLQLLLAGIKYVWFVILLAFGAKLQGFIRPIVIWQSFPQWYCYFRSAAWTENIKFVSKSQRSVREKRH